MTTVAIQIDDLLSLQETGRLPFGMLMADFISTTSPTVTVDKDAFDGVAVVCDGPAASDPQRVEGLVDLLITTLGPRKLKRRVRCFQQGSKGGWSPIRKMDDFRREEVAQ
jgi:hypothetical protein